MDQTYQLDLVNKEVVWQVEMTNQSGCFSGGNVIDEDGKLLKLKACFTCGAMPRDVYIKNSLLFVNCTLANVTEVYDVITCEKKAAILLYQPITFECKQISF